MSGGESDFRPPSPFRRPGDMICDPISKMLDVLKSREVDLYEKRGFRRLSLETMKWQLSKERKARYWFRCHILGPKLLCIFPCKRY